MGSEKKRKRKEEESNSKSDADAIAKAERKRLKKMKKEAKRVVEEETEVSEDITPLQSPIAERKYFQTKHIYQMHETTKLFLITNNRSIF